MFAVLAVFAVLSGCGREAASPSGPRDARRAEAPSTGTSSAPAVDRAPATSAREMPEPLQRAIALIERGRFDDARALVAPLLAADADDAQAVFVQGLSYHRARDYARAQPILERALALDPSNAVVNHFLGYCRFHNGDLDGARASFEAHLRTSPDESDSHFGLGLVDLEEGRLEDAERRFRHAIELIERARTENPPLYQRRRLGMAKSYARLGDIAFARGDYAGARDLVRKAIGIDPNQYASYYTLSQIERRLGNDEEAARMQALFEQMAAARHGRPPAETDP